MVKGNGCGVNRLGGIIGRLAILLSSTYARSHTYMIPIWLVQSLDVLEYQYLASLNVRFISFFKNHSSFTRWW